MSLAAPRRRVTGDAGTSLAELIVATAICALVLTVAGTLFTATLRQSRVAAAKTTSGSDARIGMEIVSRDLRVAIAPATNVPAVSSATATDLTFFTSRGPSTATSDPIITKVWLWIDTAASCLRRATAPATSVGPDYGPAARPPGSCVARGTINAGGTALFTYYPRATTATPSPAPLVLPSESVPAADLPRVAAVNIILKVTTVSDATVTPSELRGQVTLINVTNDLERKGLS